MMSDLVELFRRADAEFDRRVRAVRDDQWGGPTPCTEWSVRDLVHHLVHESLWVPPLLEGERYDEVGDRFEGDVLGEDPKGAWERAAARARDAVTTESLDRTVHVSFGEIRGTDYVTQLATDRIIHAWDLARAIGADERLEDDLVRWAHDVLEPVADNWRESGVFGPKVETSEDDDLQTKMLALVGRRTLPHSY